VLLALGGLGVPGAQYWRQEKELARLDATHQHLIEQSRTLTNQVQTHRTEAQARLDEVQKQLAELPRERDTAVQKAEAEVNAHRLHMLVVGPEKVEPGAVNTYQVRLLTKVAQQLWPVSGQVRASVVDQATRKPVATVRADRAGAGAYQLTLPRDVALAPGSRLALEIHARGDEPAMGERTEEVPLVSPRYVTHLTTDKPMYQPGETVYFRSLTLERFGLTPPRDNLHPVYTVHTPTDQTIDVTDGRDELADVQGAPVRGPDGKPIQGVGAGQWKIDAGLPGGEYRLVVSEKANRFAPQERKFLVNRYQPPRLNKELEFTAKSYGPGDPVVAACKVSLAENAGQPVADQPVYATVNVDGQTYDASGQPSNAPIILKTDRAGAVDVKFHLPGDIKKGEASLSVIFGDGANAETLVRPIPVVLHQLRVDFYPEGGDLIAGLPSRVYFQAQTPLDKPAELKGRIVDDRGRLVVKDVHTFNDSKHPGANQGMGRFQLVPQTGRSYRLRIDSPAGIEGTYDLPKVKADGIVLSVPRPVTPAGAPIRVTVQSGPRAREVLVGAYCRGRVLAYQYLKARHDQPTEVVLTPEGGEGGVYRVTVFEDLSAGGGPQKLVPRAERLTYRRPAQRLDIQVHPDKPYYVPGDHVHLDIEAKDEHGKPAAAVLMVAATDKSVLKLADEKTYRSMPTHFLLTSEVRRPEDLEHADFLLTDHKSAAEAVDLLLGTQGWRRFAEQDPNEFRQKYPKDGGRLLVLNGQLTPDLLPRAYDPDLEKVQSVRLKYIRREADLGEQFKQATAARAAADSDPRLSQIAEDKRQDKDVVAAYQDAAATVNEERQWFNEAATGLLPYAAVCLLLLALLSMVAALRRRLSAAAMTYLMAAACCLLLCGLATSFFLGRNPGVHVAMRPTLPHGQVSGPASPTDVTAPDHPQEAKEMFLGQQRGNMAPGMGNGAGMMDQMMQKAQAMPGGFGGGAPPPPGPVPPPRAPEAPVPMMAKGGPGNLANAAQGAPRAQAKPGVAEPERMRAVPMDRAKMDGAGAAGRKFPAPMRGMGQGKAAQADQPFQKRELPPFAAVRQAPRDLAIGRRMAGVPVVPVAPMQPPMRLDAEAKDKQALGGLRALGTQGPVAALSEAEQAARLEPLPERLVVREYAHVHTHGESDVRQDFQETVCWKPAVVLANGRGEVSFDLSDSVTTFEVRAAGHTLDGRIGEVTHALESRKPLTLEPKLPIEVTAGDTIDVPVAIANSTSKALSVPVQVKPTDLDLVDGAATDEVKLEPNGRVRRLYRFRPTAVEGEAQLTLSGGSGPDTDQVTRTIRVVPDGFPVVGNKSDMLEKVARIDGLLLPQTWVKGTLRFQVTAYPSTLAELQKGLEAMLREPGGCFEQSSSSNYPNLLILNYLNESNQARPEVVARARDLLAHGYQQLTAFECIDPRDNRRSGYEWFGGTAPPHEALTAYGLLEFRDMARVYPVDEKMVERTRNYLLARRDGKGGFERNPRALDSFGRAPQDITNAYIVWALTEGGKQDDVTRELDALVTEAKTSKDPYFLSLVAKSLLNRGRSKDGVALLQKVAEAQKPDGHLEAAATSITGSAGRDLEIETTALALYGWLGAQRPDLFNRHIQSAVKWIGQQRGGYGGYGSTQSTILALRSLIAYAKANKKTAEAGDLIVFVGGQAVARKHFAAGVEEAIAVELPDAEQQLKPGKNDVRVELTGNSVFPYTATWSYRTRTPASAAGCPVGLATHLDRSTAREAETVRLTVRVENKSGRGQGMTVAVIGLPGGLTVPEDMKQLKDHCRLRDDGTKPGRVSAFEIRGRELVLYWRDLAPDQKIEVPVDLICRVPGEYRGPASRAYLYYNADHKCWVEPLQIRIRPKGGT
jgi:hypothetical protein